MNRKRVIPVLLIDRDGGLVKTVRFGKRTYIGDPINAVRIFNDKEVDELVVLDIDAGKDNRAPNVRFIEDIVSEAFMPISYGGGISTVQQMRELNRAGAEKCILRTAALTHPELVEQAASEFGSQSVVACIDYKRNWLGNTTVASSSGNHKQAPVALASELVQRGAGELIVQSIDRDGTFQGYDIELLRSIVSAVRVPVVACGGAGSIQHLRSGIVEAGCDAVAAGSMFVYQAQHRGVLISYPGQQELRTIWDK